MGKCGECKEQGHPSIKHDVPCLICGQTKKFPLSEVKEAIETYKCGDIEAHEKVRNLWSLPHDAAMRVKHFGVHERPPTKGG